jgi:23S rRNA pseudouridine2605 synthase
MAVERLQKVLARAGVASRRAAEQLIADGKVRVNGRIVTEMGVKVDGYRDKVEVNGRRIVAEKPAYYILHKPRKVVATLNDPEGRETIKDLIAKIPERVHPVGRLDYHTSGALLLTNDGQMTEALLRPAKAVPKIYVVKVQGHLQVEDLDKLRNGVVLDDGYTTKPANLFVLREEANQTWLQITLTEGKNRQIHRMLEAIGRRVNRLARTEFADVSTEGLRPGEVRRINDRELDKLKKRYLAPYRAAKGSGGHQRGGPAAGTGRDARGEDVDGFDGFGDDEDD